MPEEFISYSFQLDGVTCIKCTDTIQRGLEQSLHGRPEIQRIVTDARKKIAIIWLQTLPCDEAAFVHNTIDAIEAVGYNAQYISRSVGATIAQVAPADDSAAIRRHFFKGLFGIISGIIFLVLMSSGLGIPLYLLYLFTLLSGLITLMLGYKFYYNAVKNLYKSRQLGMDALFTVSTVTALVVLALSFVFPWLSIMLETGPLIFGFRHLGIAVKKKLELKIIPDQRFCDLAPSSVQRVNATQQLIECPVATLYPEDIIVVYPGTTIPVNVVYLGTLPIEVDKSIITGSLFPVTISPNALLLAGTKLLETSQPLRLKVVATVEDSYLMDCERSAMEAKDNDIPLKDTTSRIIQYFIPMVLLFALISVVVISYFFGLAAAISCAIAVLVSACPCTFGMIAPLATEIGKLKGLNYGVQYKSGKSFIAADKVTDIVLDLNGTITSGQPSVNDFHIFDENLTNDDFWQIAVAMEQHSGHLFARSTVQLRTARSATQHTTLTPPKAYIPGISAQINGDMWTIGNSTMMHAHLNIDVELYNHMIAPNSGEQLTFIARNNIIVGYISLTDTIRAGVPALIEELRIQGKRVHICTGATQAVAWQYADLLKIPYAQVLANCMPSAKKAYIEGLRAQSGCIVAMVGDGPNDVPAMMAANVGIAVQSPVSAPLTRDQADIVIQQDSLQPLVSMFVIATQTVSNIKQNIAMSLCYNLTLALIAGGLSLLVLGVVFPPGLAVGLMIAQSCLILLNTYRLKRQNVPQLPVTTTAIKSSHQRLNTKIKTQSSPAKILTPEPEVTATTLLTASSAPVSQSQTLLHEPCVDVVPSERRHLWNSVRRS